MNNLCRKLICTSAISQKQKKVATIAKLLVGQFEGYYVCTCGVDVPTREKIRWRKEVQWPPRPKRASRGYNGTLILFTFPMVSNHPSQQSQQRPRVGINILTNFCDRDLINSIAKKSLLLIFKIITSFFHVDVKFEMVWSVKKCRETLTEFKRIYHPPPDWLEDCPVEKVTKRSSWPPLIFSKHEAPAPAAAVSPTPSPSWTRQFLMYLLHMQLCVLVSSAIASTSPHIICSHFTRPTTSREMPSPLHLHKFWKTTIETVEGLEIRDIRNRKQVLERAWGSKLSNVVLGGRRHHHESVMWWMGTWTPMITKKRQISRATREKGWA